MGNINLHQVIVEQLTQDQSGGYNGESTETKAGTESGAGGGSPRASTVGPQPGSLRSGRGASDSESGCTSVDVDVESVSSEHGGGSGGMRTLERSPGGLPHGGAKPSPLAMVNSITRTTATVPPLSQPSPSNSITSVGSNSALNATRQSSFAAALRKLAKQAGDTDPNEASADTSPGSTGSNQTSTTTPSRDQARDNSSTGVSVSSASSIKTSTAPSGGFSGSQASSTLNSAPVVTIAPTPSHRPYLSTRRSSDVTRTTSSSSSSTTTFDPSVVKQEHDTSKMAAMPSSSHRDDDRPASSLPKPEGGSQRVTPHGSGGPGPEEGGAAGRGFQPYRPGDASDLSARHPPVVAPQFPTSPFASPLDPLYSAAMAYHGMMAPPPHPYSAHPAYRMETDPLLMERYRLLQSGQMFQYVHPSMLGAPGAAVHPYLAAMGGHYPQDLLTQQHLSYLASLSGVKAMDHVSPGSANERPKTPEDQRREREDREREREREREEHLRREKEREERERRERDERERRERERERERERSVEKYRHHDSRDSHHHHHHSHHPPHSSSHHHSSTDNHHSGHKSPSSSGRDTFKREAPDSHSHHHHLNHHHASSHHFPPNHILPSSSLSKDSPYNLTADGKILVNPSSSTSSSVSMPPVGLSSSSSSSRGLPKPQDQPLNLHKTEDLSVPSVPNSLGVHPLGLDGNSQMALLEQERLRMHQQFLREQDLLLHERDMRHSKMLLGSAGDKDTNNHLTSSTAPSLGGISTAAMSSLASSSVLPSAAAAAAYSSLGFMPYMYHGSMATASTAKSPGATGSSSGAVVTTTKSTGVTLSIPKIPSSSSHRDPHAPPSHHSSHHPSTTPPHAKEQRSEPNKFHRPFEGKNSSSSVTATVNGLDKDLPAGGADLERRLGSSDRHGAHPHASQHHTSPHHQQHNLYPSQDSNSHKMSTSGDTKWSSSKNSLHSRLHNSHSTSSSSNNSRRSQYDSVATVAPLAMSDRSHHPSAMDSLRGVAGMDLAGRHENALLRTGPASSVVMATNTQTTTTTTLTMTVPHHIESSSKSLHHPTLHPTNLSANMPKDLVIKSENVTPSHLHGSRHRDQPPGAPLPMSMSQSSHSYLPQGAAFPSLAVAETPVIFSKLDLEERRLRQARSSASLGDDASDSDESEDDLDSDIEGQDERQRQRLLVISSGPTLKRDHSASKLNFLGQFGLKTQLQRKDEEYENRMKRRKIYHERSETPIEVEDVARCSPLVLPPSVNTEQLNSEPDYRKKRKFLVELGLESVPTERKRELDMIHRVCEWDRNRRLGEMDKPLPLLMGMDGNPHPHLMWYNRLIRPQPLAHQSATTTPGIQPVNSLKPVQNETESKETPVKKGHSGASPLDMPPSLPQVADMPLSLSQGPHSHPPSLHHHSAMLPSQSNGLLATSTPAGKAEIMPPHSQSLWAPNASGKSAFSTPPQPEHGNTRRAISREFAQEFHESVLQTTRQQQQEQRTVHGGEASVEVHYTLDEDGNVDEDRKPLTTATPGLPNVSPIPGGGPLLTLPPSSLGQPLGPHTMMPGLATSPNPSQHDSRRLQEDQSYKWPGIEAVHVAYQKHLEGTRLEQQILKDQCAFLQNQSCDLNRTGEKLSLQMADLLTQQQKLMEDRLRIQQSLDNLKKCLKLPR